MGCKKANIQLLQNVTVFHVCFDSKNSYMMSSKSILILQNYNICVLQWVTEQILFWHFRYYLLSQSVWKLFCTLENALQAI